MASDPLVHIRGVFGSDNACGDAGGEVVESGAQGEVTCPKCRELPFGSPSEEWLETQALRARLAAAEAVVEAARRLANGEDTNASWTLLAAALAAYDKARGAGG